MEKLISLAKEALQQHAPIYLHQIRWERPFLGKFYFKCPMDHRYDFNLEVNPDDKDGILKSTLNDIIRFASQCMSHTDAVTVADYANDVVVDFTRRNAEDFNKIKKSTQYVVTAIDRKRNGLYKEAEKYYYEALLLWPDLITIKNYAKLFTIRGEYDDAVWLYFIAYAHRMRLTGNLKEIDMNWLKDAGMALAATEVVSIFIKLLNKKSPWEILTIEDTVDKIKIPLAITLYQFAADPNLYQKHQNLYRSVCNRVPEGFLDTAYNAAINLANTMFSNILVPKDTELENILNSLIRNRKMIDAHTVYEEVLF